MKVLRNNAVSLADLLPDDVMDRIRAAGADMVYSDGQLVQERGETWKGISIVRSGQVVAGNVGDDGSFLVSALLRKGECFGEFTLFLGLARSHSLWAQGRTEITHVKAPAFLALFDSEPQIPRALLTMTLLRNYEMLDFLDAQRRLSLTARIARLLLAASDASTGETVVACRQEDLAFMLGVSRVSVGKALKKMQAGGLVAPGYGTIRLLDISGLRQHIASDDRFVPLEPQQPVLPGRPEGKGQPASRRQDAVRNQV